MAENRVNNIVVPDDTPTSHPSTTAVSATVSVILGKDNQVFFYNGLLEDAMKNNTIVKTNYNVYIGIGECIRAKQKWLDTHYEKKRDGMVLLIKPTDASTYQNFIDAIDEVTINDVKTYVVMQPSAAELSYVQTH